MGIISKNEVYNFNKAAADVCKKDMLWREANGNYILPNEKVDHRLPGILRDYTIDYDWNWDKPYTPIKIILFDMYSVKAFNYCAKGRCVVINIDGTQSQVNWGAYLTEGVSNQRWEMSMRGTFRLASKSDSGRIVKQNIKPYRLWQYHSTQTKTKPLSDAIAKFFNSQTVIGLIRIRDH